MPNTYKELLKTTVGTATSSVTLDLTGISGYTDLILQCSLRADTSTFNNMNYPIVRFNNDSTSGLYSTTNLYARNTGSGDGAYSTRSSSQNEINLGGVATSAMASGIFSTYQIQLQNYANTSVFKTVLGRIGTGGNLTALDGTWASVGLWRNTNAITSISLTPTSSGLFQVGSTFSLYGIANADQGAAKATGGIITEDSQYWYHTFGASGAFIPKQSLTCDVLVVAGGGSGGNGGGGGGGAGGVRLHSSQLLTSTNYNVTVGGGGAANLGANAKGNNGIDSQFASLTVSTGGGGGGNYIGGAAGNSGGSGGGAQPSANGTTAGATASPSGQGNNGGSGSTDNVTYRSSGGGGGAGAVGANGSGSANTSGAGGNGVSTYSSWGAATGMGQNIAGTYWFAGGGGGGNSAAAGGNGGGTAGAPGGNSANGTAYTGGGSGGAGTGGAGSTGSGNGGSGVVIVRYAK